MGLFNFPSNPVEIYDVSSTVLEITRLQEQLDEKIHNFLIRASSDSALSNAFDVEEEWRCWIEKDYESSCLLFDEDLLAFDDDSFEHFKENYAGELSQLLKENNIVQKKKNSIDELLLFKTSLFNVFNNHNNLSLDNLIDQIVNRAPNYGIKVYKSSENDYNLILHFNPLEKINQDHTFYDYKMLLTYNPNYEKDGFMYTGTSMEACSRDSYYTGPIKLPIMGDFVEFDKSTNSFFLNDHYCIFFNEARAAVRKNEKTLNNIPQNYYEGYFLDRTKIIDYSEKSFRYGTSSIYIPKSQVVLTSEKVYVNPWYYRKLKPQIEQYENFLVDKTNSLESKIKEAENSSSYSQPPNSFRQNKDDIQR